MTEAPRAQELGSQLLREQEGVGARRFLRFMKANENYSKPILCEHVCLDFSVGSKGLNMFELYIICIIYTVEYIDYDKDDVRLRQ